MGSIFRLQIAVIGLVLASCGFKLESAKQSEKEKPGTAPVPSEKGGGPESEGTAPVAASEGEKAGLAEKVDLTNIVGFALTEKEGASLKLDDVEPAAASKEVATTSVEAPIESGSNVYGYDNKGVAHPIKFGKGMARFSKIYTTPKALLMVLSRWQYGSCQLVVLTFSDGRLFCVADFSIGDNGRGQEPVQASKNGDLVTVEGWAHSNEESDGWSKLYRLDLSEAGKVKVSKIYDKKGYPENWAVNDDGDVLVRYEDRPARQLRALKADGSFDPLGEAEYIRCLVAGKGAQGNEFYHFYSDGMTSQWRSVKKDAESKYSVSELYSVSSTDNSMPNFWGCRGTLVEENEIYYSGEEDPRQYAGKVPVMNLNLKTPGIRTFWVDGMRSARNIFRAGEKRIVVEGKDSNGSGMIVAIDTTTGVNTILLRTGKFVIDSIRMDGNSLSFVAERQKDSASIAGKIENFSAEAEPTATVISVVKPKQLVQLPPR